MDWFINPYLFSTHVVATVAPLFWTNPHPYIAITIQHTAPSSAMGLKLALNFQRHLIDALLAEQTETGSSFNN